MGGFNYSFRREIEGETKKQISKQNPTHSCLPIYREQRGRCDVLF